MLGLAGCQHRPGPPPEPDAQAAFADLHTQVDCGPRIPGSPGLECARRHILTELRRCTPRVGTQAFTIRDPYGADSLHFENLLANFYPERAARVLLAAHYDTRPRADRDTGMARDLPIPGANDGASGVAVLLEIARVLARWDPGIGVDLAFLDGEDYGHESDLDYYCMGSKHFVRTMGAYRPRAVILLDMVGDRDLHIPKEGNSMAAAPDLVKLVFDTAAELGVTSFSQTDGPALYDDHIAFLRARIPAVDLIDFEYPQWHTLQDTPEHCAPESLAGVARVVLHSLVKLAAKSA
jgi:hypothetical protein